MNFVERQVEFQGKRKLIKVDQNNVPLSGEEPILVNVVKDEGAVLIEGTPINAENLNKGNWRDDDSVSFELRKDNNIPSAKSNKVQIVSKLNGEIWVVPAQGNGESFRLRKAGTIITVNNAEQEFFNADTKLNIMGQAADSLKLNGKNENMLNVESSQKLSTPRSIGGVSFDGTADITLSKGSVGLENVDNTSDMNKPVSFLVQNALNLKVNSSEKGTANGVASLGGDGKVPTNQLPDSTIGVQSINQKTGQVILTKSDIGLSNVDNTSDSSKTVFSSTKLANSKNIAGISFDGTSNIDIPFANLTSKPSTVSGYGITDVVSSYMTGAAGRGEAVVAKNMAQNGYIRYASGLIIQWGVTTTNGTRSFPLAFPNQCGAVVVSGVSNAWEAVNARDITTSTFYPAHRNNSHSARFIAIGR